MMHFDEWWNSAAADSFRAKHEDLDGEVFRTVWDAAQLGQAAIEKAEGTADDQGWSQSDMDTADALDGLLAAAPQPPVGAVPQWDGVIKPSDFIVNTFRRGASGWVPNPDNCVRITHRPTGFFEEETAMRSVHANKSVAWQRLSDRLESLAAAPQPPDTTAAWVRPATSLQPKHAT